MVVVARELTERGLLPRRPTLSKPRKVPFWTKDAISRVLSNPLYAGIITCGEDEVVGEHEPLVDEETWRASQRIIAERARERTNHGVNVDYILRGLLRCGACGAGPIGYLAPGNAPSSGSSGDAGENPNPSDESLEGAERSAPFGHTCDFEEERNLCRHW
jgi:hypothetical protein